MDYHSCNFCSNCIYSSSHLFCNIEERVIVEAAEKEKVPVGKSLKALFSNQYWAICLGLWGFMVMMSTVSGTIATYYCKYVLHNQDLYSLIYAAELIAQCVVVLIVPKLIDVYKRQSLCLHGKLGNRYYLLRIFQSGI